MTVGEPNLGEMSGEYSVEWKKVVLESPRHKGEVLAVGTKEQVKRRE